MRHLFYPHPPKNKCCVTIHKYALAWLFRIQLTETVPPSYHREPTLRLGETLSSADPHNTEVLTVLFHFPLYYREGPWLVG